MVRMMPICVKSNHWSSVRTILPAHLWRSARSLAYTWQADPLATPIRVFNVNIPFSTAVLDTTSAQQMSGAAAIRMAAGHAIAFESTNNCSLAYDSSTNTLRWNQGTLSYPVGKGITVGWMNVFTSNATLANWLSGNLIFLAGGGSPYTITLPAASTVAAGTGFTFTVLGSAPVTIATDRKRHDRQRPDHAASERSLSHHLGRAVNLARPVPHQLG